MAIQGVSVSKSLNVTNLIRAQYSSGRISLPVNRNQSLYARFKHIWGFPAVNQEEGFSLSKLRVLDNLIERLNNFQGGNKKILQFTEISSGAVDSLIAQYEQQLHHLAVETPIPYGPRFSEKGLLVNILV